MGSTINTKTNSDFAGVEGSYYLQINIGNKIWELDSNDVTRVAWEEEAGNVGVAFEMDFLVKDNDILAYLNEGSKIKVTIGGLKKISREKKTGIDDSYDKHEMQVTVVEMEVKYNAFPYINISMSGVIGNYDYHVKHNMSIISQMNSLDAIKKVLSNNSEFIKVDSDVQEVPKDIQNWIQYSITDRNFISNIWLHSNFTNNILLLGINSKGHFIIRDLKSLLKKNSSKKYKYLFSNATTEQESEAKNSLQYDSILFTQSNTIMNLSYAYGREKLVYDLENGTEEFVLPNIKETGLSTNNKLNRKSSITKLANSSGMINENVHVNYHESYNYNVGMLLALSSTNLMLAFNGKFIGDIQILDPVNITVNSTDPNSQMTSDYESGGYIVSKVTRVLAHKNFTTTITACRDNMSGLKGQLR